MDVNDLPGTAPDKLQPNNVEAEEATLGALIVDRDAILGVEKILEPQDFFIKRYEWVYQAMLDLHHQNIPPDLVTLGDELERRKQLKEIGGRPWLTNLINQTPTSTYAEYYAGIVRRTGVLRRLIDAAGKVSRLAYQDNKELETILDEAQSILMPIFSLGKAEKGTVHIATPVGTVLDQVEERYNNPNASLLGIPTGLKDLDKLLGGLQRSDVIILAGRPGMGKTSLALSIALQAARRWQKRIAIFSLEMSDEQLVQRLIATETGIDIQRIRLGQIRPDEWPKFMEATDLLAKLPIYINDVGALTIFLLRNHAMRLMAEHGLDLLIIDYLQLMRGMGIKGQNREQEISDISRGIKGLARELNIPILALSQLNRDCESRQDKRPRLSDLRESGSLEQDSDEVLFVFRDEVYNPDTEFPNIAEIILGKNRHGPTGSFSVYFRKHVAQFVDLEIRQQPLEY